MKILTIVIFCILSSFAFSQKSKEKIDTLLKKKDNAEFVITYNNKISIRPFIQQTLMSLELLDKSKMSLPVIYNPNVRVYAGVDLNYRFLGLSLLFKIPPAKSAQERFGETKFVNFKLGINTTHVSLESYFQRYTGFYLFNANELYKNAQQNLVQTFATVFSDTMPQKPDLRVSMFGLNLYLQWSGKLSMAAAFSQTKRQIKNAGSLLFLLSYQYAGIANKDTLVPLSTLNKLENIARYRSGIYNTFSFAPGYGYTYVINKQFYVTLLGYAGVGLQPQYVIYSDDTEFKVKGSYKLSFKTALGYNSDMFFAGLSAGLDLNTINMESMQIRIMPMFWKLGGGIRF